MVRKIKLPIILVENSGYDFPELAAEKVKYKDRFEVISFKEDDMVDAIYARRKDSKGSCELYAIQYAYNHSSLLNNCGFIIKITGRYYIPEFENFLYKHDLNLYDGLRQWSDDRCEIIGSSRLLFNYIFDTKPLDENGNYSTIVEGVYKYRFFLLSEEKILRCKKFTIEPTQRGGLNEVFYEL